MSLVARPGFFTVGHGRVKPVTRPHTYGLPIDAVRWPGGVSLNPALVAPVGTVIA